MIAAAIQRRGALAAQPDAAVRLVHAESDNLPGLVIEQLADVLIVQCHEERLRISMDELHAALQRLCAARGLRAAYRKLFPRDRSHASGLFDAQHRDAQPWCGKPVEAEITVSEGPSPALRFLVRPYDGYATGLFLEHRDNRERVRACSAGKRVLNAFAYTCAYAVAAAVGGAAEVVNVDVSRRYLEWGKQNCASNALDIAGQRFICDDIFNYYRRAARQQLRFDLLVLDPPTFARSRQSGAAFSLPERLDALVAGAVELLAPGGGLLLSCNHRGTDVERLRRAIRNTGRRVRQWEAPPLPPDFPSDPAYARSVWAWFD